MKQSVKLGRLRHLVDRMEGCPDDMELSFEFFMASLFPTILDSIKEYVTREYTLGYIAAKREVRESVEGNN